MTRFGLVKKYIPTRYEEDDFGGNIPQCPSELISWWIKAMAEHGKCERVQKLVA